MVAFNEIINYGNHVTMIAFHMFNFSLPGYLNQINNKKSLDRKLPHDGLS